MRLLDIEVKEWRSLNKLKVKSVSLLTIPRLTGERVARILRLE
jgi:hypothetical protein